MKKLFTLTFLILQLSFVFAQNQNISKLWGLSSKEEGVGDIFEVNNNTYFASVYRYYPGEAIFYESIILKLDSNCNVIDSLKLLKYHKKGKQYSIIDFHNFNNRIIGNGYAVDSLTQKINIWLTEFDEDLTILRDTLLGNEDSLAHFCLSRLLPTSQNNLMLAIPIFPPVHDSTDMIGWLIDSNFCIIKENQFAIHFTFNHFSFVEMPSSQSFHIVTEDQITKINNTDLSYDSVIWHTDYFSSGGPGAKKINDSVYIHPTPLPFMLPGSFHDNGNITCLFVRDKNAIATDTILIGNMQKSFARTSTQNVDFSSPDSIFVCGTNYSIDSSFDSQEDNTIFIWNISLSGNINWQKYYSMNRKIIVTDIKKTSDGGCFMVGTAWDWHHYQQYTNDIFFLKVDRNGNVCGSLGINEIITQSEILVYPNPAIDNLNFDIGMYKDFQLSVYNQMGQTIMQKNFTSGNNTINIGDFKPGIYFYNLQNKNGKVISGKFVKE